MKILLAPHDDDSALFASFTCIREKPLVVIVTDAFIQTLRGEQGCDSVTRARESEKAHEILGCPVMRLHLRDDCINREMLEERLSGLSGVETVYAPAVQGGNQHHDLVALVAYQMFKDKLIQYTTYSRRELWTIGDTEVIPNKKELELKNRALDCYISQKNLPATKPHFEAVYGKSEWLIKNVK